MPDIQQSDEELIRLGYRCTSRKYGIISRIDRPDWVLFLIEKLNQPELISGDGSWEDFYRRVYSRDKLELSPSRARKFPTSSWDPIGFVEK